MKSLFVFMMSLIALGHLNAQEHQFSLLSSFQYNQQNYYLPNRAIDLGTEVPSGLIKYAFGLKYTFLFEGQNKFAISGGANYGYRSFITQIDIAGAPHYDVKSNAEFIDLLIGFGMIYSLNKNIELGFQLYPGVGLPLQDVDDSNSIVRPDELNVDIVQPFIQLNAIALNHFSRKARILWSISAEPFVRGYINAMYDHRQFSDDNPPFLAYGIEVCLNIRVKK